MQRINLSPNLKDGLEGVVWRVSNRLSRNEYDEHVDLILKSVLIDSNIQTLITCIDSVDDYEAMAWD